MYNWCLRSILVVVVVEGNFIENQCKCMNRVVVLSTYNKAIDSNSIDNNNSNNDNTNNVKSN